MRDSIRDLTSSTHPPNLSNCGVDCKTALYKHMEYYAHKGSPGFLLLVLSAWISCCVVFYLPGPAPVSYCEPGRASNPACLVSVYLAYI